MKVRRAQNKLSCSVDEMPLALQENEPESFREIIAVSESCLNYWLPRSVHEAAVEMPVCLNNPKLGQTL